MDIQNVSNKIRLMTQNFIFKSPPAPLVHQAQEIVFQSYEYCT